MPSVAQDWLVTFEEQLDRLFPAQVEVIVVAGLEIVEQRRQGRRAQGYGMALGSGALMTWRPPCSGAGLADP